MDTEFVGIFTVGITLFLPIMAGLIATLCRKSAKGVLLGMTCFLVFQVFTRLPLLQSVLPQWAGFVLFQTVAPVWYLGFLALTAGLFEECGRYIMIRLFFKKSTCRDSIAFGIGHGGIESILLVGIPLLSMLVTQGGAPAGFQTMDFFLVAIERFFAMLVHIGLSVMVWKSVISKKYMLWTAVLVHSVFNFTGGILTHIGVPIYLIELVAGLFAAALLLYTVWMVRRERAA